MRGRDVGCQSQKRGYRSVGASEPGNVLPDPVEWLGLADWVHDRGGEKEVRVRPAVLPVWWGGKLHIVRWGNKERQEQKLPPTGWTWKETVESG